MTDNPSNRRNDIERAGLNTSCEIDLDMAETSQAGPTGGGNGQQTVPRTAAWTTTESAESSNGRPSDHPPTVLFSHNISQRIQTSTSSEAPGLGSDVDVASRIDAPATNTENEPSRSKSRTRDRGYSLRRSLFAQRVQKQNQEHGTAIEMEPTSSASAPSFANTKGVKDATSVIVEEANGSGLTPSSTKTSYTDKNTAQLPTHVSRSNQHADVHLVTALLTSLQQLRERIFGPSTLPPTVNGRHVRVNINPDHDPIDERSGKPYIGNKIRSCKYSAWNFLPKQLFAQFSKLANFYFLTISILQMIPGLSTVGSFTTIIPLAIFVSISMAKEGYEDIRRNRLDKEENERFTFVLNKEALRSDLKNEQNTPNSPEDSDSWTKTKWQDVKVGDVVRLARNNGAPADIVLLHASGADAVAHIETKSLDGETNLKSKKPAGSILTLCQSEGGVANLDADFVVEDPNLDLYKFDGRVSVEGRTLPLGLSEVVYRGSTLRNTAFAIGLVVYSGEECKIRMNANKDPRVKAPTLQTEVNRVVIIVAALVLFIAVICSIGYILWKPTENSSWYIEDADVPFAQILVGFIILLNTMLPLSLYVSLEIVKVAQIFMMNDIDMYDPDSDIPMEPKTSTLNEELGQVSYIFSDKTGTLTNNSMKFRKMSIAGTAWLHDSDLRDNGGSERSPKLKHKKRKDKGKQKQNEGTHGKRGSTSKIPLVSVASRPMGESLASDVDERLARFSHTGKTGDLLEYIFKRPQSLFARKVRFFLLALALCHTCIPEKDDNGDINFQAASPDELALVTAAKDLGYIVTDRQANSMTVKTYPAGEDEEPVYESYEILDVIEFSSNRKRASILLRLPDSRICLFCKGADQIISERLRLSSVAQMCIDSIRDRTNASKIAEAQSAIQRRSTTLSRQSFSVPRHSSTLGRQNSVSLSRRQSVRESVDLWLKDRESDAVTTPRKSMHYAPRHSETVTAQGIAVARSARQSTDSPRASFQSDDLHDLIDESIVMNEKLVFERCFNHIDDFATEGLRTLMYGHRFVLEDEYRVWKQRYHEAATSLVQRQEKIEKVAESIEVQLELTGATAIEDKLQVGTADAIERFRRAGIKIWMLTGDKRETAINIGHSCHLIKSYSTIMILDQAQKDFDLRLENYLREVDGGQLAHGVLVIDGQTLTAVDSSPTRKTIFTSLATVIDSVICCRASPSQKADLVKTIRTKVKGSVTLAIGDGANDIAMIREAHVGIGIAGKEGLQAARTSDYSIAQFRFLVKLLLVHGRWNYLRVSKYVLGTFWKEMIFYLVQATYQRWNGYTGTSLYEPWSLSMFNTLFTSLPVIFLGVFEKDLAPSTLLAVPELYSYGRLSQGFRIFPNYVHWATLGAVEAMIVYFMMEGIYFDALFTRDNGLFASGALAFTACVTLISLKLQFIELHNKSLTAGIACFLSLGGWYMWNLILAAVYNISNRIYLVRDAFVHSFGRNVLWWMTLVVIVSSVALLELVLKAVKAIYFPNDVELFQVLERDLEVKSRFEESAADLLQAGWSRGSKKSSFEIARDEEEQTKREAEVQEILDRPRTMDTSGYDAPPVGIRKRQSWQPVDLEMITTNQEMPPRSREASRSE